MPGWWEISYYPIDEYFVPSPHPRSVCLCLLILSCIFQHIRVPLTGSLSLLFIIVQCVWYLLAIPGISIPCPYCPATGRTLLLTITPGTEF